MDERVRFQADANLNGLIVKGLWRRNGSFHVHMAAGKPAAETATLRSGWPAGREARLRRLAAGV